MATPLTNFSEQSIPEVGADDDVWGTTNNGAHAVWDRALGGRHVVSTTGGTTTLTATEGQNGVIDIIGTLASAAIIEVPTGKYRRYYVNNQTTGDYSLTVRAAGGTDGVVVPQGAYQCVSAFGTAVVSFSPAMNARGGVPDTLRNPNSGSPYSGPGFYFSNDPAIGLANRGSGVLGIGLLASAGGDQVRFYGNNSVSNPLIAITPPGTSNFDSGIRAVTSSVIRSMEFVTNGTARMMVRTGVTVNDPTGGDQGVGTVNVSSGLYVGGVLAGVPRELAAIPLNADDGAASTEHNLGAKPRQVEMYLRCTVADHSYSVGDDVKPVTYQTVSDRNDGITLWKNSTEVGVGYNDIFISKKGSSAPDSVPTPGRWSIVFVVTP